MSSKKSFARSKAPRLLALVLSLVALAVVVARLDLRPSLGHVHLRLLSGPPEGNYHAMGEAVAAAAAKRGGRIESVATAGSLENVARLAAAAHTCEVEVALVQAGVPVPASPELTLIARLAKAESLFFLGKRADAITDFAQLAHLRIGVGPEGSGTARVVEQLFASRDLRGLGVVLSHHAETEQLDLAQRGELDLAALVIDEDAALIQSAVRDRGLALVGFPHADVLARQFPFLRKGRIGAGEYDAVRMLPPVDKEVLRIDTWVLGNGCARRSQVMGLLVALEDVFPDLKRHIRETPNVSGLAPAPAAKAWIEGGPELLDEYLPRVSDVMPPSNWLHLIMAVSILFNAMGIGNRFVLWRIDAARVRAEHEIAACFGPEATMGDIARLSPSGALLVPGIGVEIDRVIATLTDLAQRSRRASLSVLVPMGGEMAYRYQEFLIHQALAVLRAFRERLVAMGNPGGVPQTPPVVTMGNPEGVPQTPPVVTMGNPEGVPQTPPVVTMGNPEGVPQTPPVVTMGNPEGVPQTPPVVTMGNPEGVPQTPPVATMGNPEGVPQTPPVATMGNPEGVPQTPPVATE